MIQSWIFSIIAPVFSITRSFRNHSNMLICYSKNIYCYYKYWKKLCCIIFLWKHVDSWIEISKEQHLFKIEIFYNNALLLNTLFVCFFFFFIQYYHHRHWMTLRNGVIPANQIRACKQNAFWIVSLGVQKTNTTNNSPLSMCNLRARVLYFVCDCLCEHIYACLCVRPSRRDLTEGEKHTNPAKPQ